MNSMKYQDIFNQNLAAPDRTLKLGHCWIIRQDNDPKHTSKSTQKWLTEHTNQASAIDLKCAQETTSDSV